MSLLIPVLGDGKSELNPKLRPRAQGGGEPMIDRERHQKVPLRKDHTSYKKGNHQQILELDEYILEKVNVFLN